MASYIGSGIRDPNAAKLGDTFYNTTLKRMRFHTVGGWVTVGTVSLDASSEGGRYRSAAGETGAARAAMNTERVILLVEDNPIDEDLMIRGLKKSHVLNPIVIARDGVEALDYLFSRGAHANRPATSLPQLILLDLKLPRLDGLEVLRTLRLDERTKLVPVVILTSSVEEQDLIRGLGFGANSYVQKPIDFIEFCETVRTLCLYWLVQNEVSPLPKVMSL